MATDFRVTIDCAAPHELADWWAEALGWTVEVVRLTGLGATELGRGSQGPPSWVTMADPEGNEFCVS